MSTTRLTEAEAWLAKQPPEATERLTPTAGQSGAGAPKCKICQQNHWLRVGCDGQAQGRHAATNTPREGHDVLKGAKPTSSASTESPNPPHSKPEKACPTSSPSRKRKKKPGKKKPSRRQRRARAGGAKSSSAAARKSSTPTSQGGGDAKS